MVERTATGPSVAIRSFAVGDEAAVLDLIAAAQRSHAPAVA